MTFHYRPATDRDLTHLQDLDLKCYERSPATPKWWKHVSENPQSGCMIACKSQVPIGMVVWERQAFRLPEFKAKVTTLHLHKLCVRKEFRCQGLGQRLLAHAHEAAREKGCPYMSISIPEYRCLPDTKPEEDVSKWIINLGFKATIILPTKVHMYGQIFDQYLFVYQVKV